jgi:hypothetical protein
MLLKKILAGVALCMGMVAATGESRAESIANRNTLREVLGGSGTIEDFETYDVGSGLGWGGTVLNSESNIGGRTGWVVPGVTFISPSNTYWNGAGERGSASQELKGVGGLTLEIDWDTPVTAFGVDLRIAATASPIAIDEATIAVYAADGTTLLNTISNIPLSTSSVFAGYEDSGGIARILVTYSRSSLPNGSSPYIDNLEFGTNLDLDDDGLSNSEEAFFGTDPEDPDTDDDGLLDGTEVDMADGTGSPDPLDPDSDDDGLLDGDEVLLGTDPSNPDTDGDGVSDAVDPLPTEPGVTSGFIEDALRFLGSDIDSLSVDFFSGKNNNAAAGRQNSMSNKANAAANAVNAGDLDSAIDQLLSLHKKIDGNDSPPDWMVESAEKEFIAAEIELLIELLLIS